MRMMVEIPIPPKWEYLWYTCDLRVFIILSLSLQILLILGAPFRKRTKCTGIIMLLWSAYLLADCAANFAVGLISSSQGNPSDMIVKNGNRVAMENEDLLAFWAPFLLVHLGGPDTITAFALEDNELWLRHLLGLVFQCIVAVYVYVQSLPQNRLWVPTMLMFLIGIIKYVERTRSLYLASANKFKSKMFTIPDHGSTYSKLLVEYLWRKEANLPTRIQMVPEPDRASKSAKKAKKGKLTKLEQVQYAYQFFETFKGLVVDMIFSQKQRNKSRDFFLNRTAKDAFKVVEIELNFLYEVLFTKLQVVFCKKGLIIRALSFATICSAIVLFIFEKKTNFRRVDVTITYILLFGGLILDVTALIMLVFSNWTIIYLRKSPDAELDNTFKTRITSAFLKLRTQGTLWDTKDHAKSKKYCKWKIKCLRRRWSETIPTYNLLSCFLNPRGTCSQCFVDTFELTNFFDVKSEKFTVALRDFIFEELKLKSEFADGLETTKEISLARGEWVLSMEEGWGTLLKYVVDVDYDQSLIIWHVATELCYHAEHQKSPKNIHRDISKLLSDYMLYLLIMQPNMMSVVVAGIGQILLQDTCAEVKRLIDNENDRELNQEDNQNGNTEPDKKINICKKILDVSTEDWEQMKKFKEILVTEVSPMMGKSDRNSLLYDSCILAKELIDIDKKNGSKNKWLIISKVWVELLCYAASHSRPKSLVEQVSKGGELITIVWLLMAHFGLGDQFQIKERQARPKLIVGK